jgi:hypothetical protein
MTAAEAATKWCPYSGTPRATPVTSANNCIGPACAVWVWLRPNQTGYCGLASNPGAVAATTQPAAGR